MATNKNEKGSTSKNSKKRLTKAELDRQKAIAECYGPSFCLVLIFPVFHDTLYNLFLSICGEYGHPLIFAIYVYLFGF